MNTTDEHDDCIHGSPISESSGLTAEKAGVDLPRMERAVREILAAVGENPDREGLLETPARVARMYAELFMGLNLDPGRHLKKVFVEEFDELVLIRDISFNSMCEHHLLPFIGMAHVGYLPRGRVVGLSKLARVVEEISHRPQVQERMTHQIADLMQKELDPKGVVVVLEACAFLHVDSRHPKTGKRDDYECRSRIVQDQSGQPRRSHGLHSRQASRHPIAIGFLTFMSGNLRLGETIVAPSVRIRNRQVP